MLSGKQKRFLRAMAVNERAICQIGKDGLDENLFKAVKENLKARELVKVAVLKTCEQEMNEIAVELCANTGAELVQKIGKTLVLFKQSRNRLIDLP